MLLRLNPARAAKYRHQLSFGHRLMAVPPKTYTTMGIGSFPEAAYTRSTVILSFSRAQLLCGSYGSGLAEQAVLPVLVDGRIWGKSGLHGIARKGGGCLKCIVLIKPCAGNLLQRELNNCHDGPARFQLYRITQIQ